MNEEAIFEYKYFNSYFTDDDRDAYFIREKETNKILGFVMVNTYVQVFENGHSIAEFMVIPKYRKNHIGKKVAFELISNCLTIIILIFNFILASFNLDNLIDSNDRFSNLIGTFGYMILPYITIAIITQIVVLVLNIINKQGKQSLNIVTLIVEIVYFIFTNFAVTPFMFFNLFFFNKLLAYLVFLVKF